MGCVSSKQTVSVTPAIDHSGVFRDNVCSGSGRIMVEDPTTTTTTTTTEKKLFSWRSKSGKKSSSSSKKSGSEFGELSESGRASSNCRSESVSFRLGNLSKYLEAEQVAAGWPAWLSNVAGEAIHGWVPFRSDAFEKLEKIGQGTYSSVFRARETETGRIVALKKVRFDNFEPESVRFMAREILILRRLNHPNIIKLQGIVTSKLSCNIHLVFEYMEHDLTGLLSSPDINFTTPQIKCYMKQLLSGLEHCHARGVMHRDIKGSNLLVNNEGILKVADFGLANFCNASGNKQPLTSRVVTLWYRPPELLLGATDYGASVDLWSVGCVFAELLLGKPVLQGRTEVEQLHKIFKLCGSPPADYWKKSKLPHAMLFKPQQHYDSCLQETLKDLSDADINLIETLLSIEPHKRGSASTALVSQYFTSKPFACDPSSLPVYSPSKEIDAKHREETTRKKICGNGRRGTESRKPTRKPPACAKLAPVEDVRHHSQKFQKRNGHSVHNSIDSDATICEKPQKPSSNHEKDEASHVKNASQGDVPFSGPLQVSVSSGFAWAKRRKDDICVRSHNRSLSRGHITNLLGPSPAFSENTDVDSKINEKENEEKHGAKTDSQDREAYEMLKLSMLKKWRQLERPDSFDTSDEYHSQELSLALYQKEEKAAKLGHLGYEDNDDKIEFSGPLLSKSYGVDELLERHERQIRQLVRKSWFQKGKKKQGK
ncbi:PREDICTED: probable serine/threonine-protein kinase At1g54610 isoform X1 [Camelina sativa]|uniref:Probable serine/threonine-protein kinase At1g54610 isoform X1 n=1 Tax=Camelina sativa TaxID=90675 RepID=A0ABM0WW86_CAMSA|nr:PREDICTED: probable serine/threonine-protein kinase At1g54610 isoform X1 [Camelina sativa]